MKICPIAAVAMLAAAMAAAKDKPGIRFETADRCMACHNELKTASGKDVSIGYAWRASIMANSSRDPYWQASVRRETIDHGAVTAHIEDECSVCHMPVTRYQARLEGKAGQIFVHLPFSDDKKQGREAADGVDCSVCHQISDQKLGSRESFNGGFVIEGAEDPHNRPEYGPFPVERGQQRIMSTSTGLFQPTERTDPIRKSELCATCHTLITTAFGAGGKEIGALPEQMPYKEWLNSDFKTRKSCQDCHMPVVDEPAPITRVFGVPRVGMKQHVFVAANFLMQRMLNRYRGELEVEALPQELSAAADYTVKYLKDQAARVSIENAQVVSGRVEAEVFVENLGGHKLPTAYPSRRAWLHFSVKDRNGSVVFESGALRPDGSIVGNDNDADATKYEPHYSEITNSEQVEIYEDILGDANGRVTTGLLTGVRYLKDNRILPVGFDKHTTDSDIAVAGKALDDAGFVAGGHRIRYAVSVGNAQGPFTIEAELWYQPIGFRWANNLKAYDRADEPKRFNNYYDAMTQATAELLARASVTR
ncbi:MAG: hypothetical protein JO091_05005 [Acidobacteriaceae bacterium]|nr:hypothetical protein [Acidobacteriaceae bacterium]